MPGYAIMSSFLMLNVFCTEQKLRKVGCLCLITKDSVFVCLFVIFHCYMKAFQIIFQPYS